MNMASHAKFPLNLGLPATQKRERMSALTRSRDHPIRPDGRECRPKAQNRTHCIDLYHCGHSSSLISERVPPNSLSGTGKWQGIKGGGQYQPVSRGKNFPDGTVAYCNSHTGKYMLP
jgi:hypothetical protein